MGLPVTLYDATQVAARAVEVPDAAWDDGMNYGSNACGVGINFGEGEVVGTPEQFTLLDQTNTARTPQNSALLGGDPLALDNVTNDGSGDGSVTVNGTVQLAALATGWVQSP